MRHDSVGATLSETKRVEEHPRSREIEDFLTEHYRRVVGSVALITGDRASAEDAVQDALVKSWRRRGEEIEVFPAWITVVASNGARSGWRKTSAEKRAVERLAQRSIESPTPESEQLDQELLDALALLPLRERQAAVLFYVSDWSVREIAAALSVAEGTVKTLLSRARQHLGESLGKDTTEGAA